MKKTAILLCFAALLATTNTNAQGVLPDSAVYFTYSSAASLSQDVVFSFYIKETLQLDSTNIDGAHYTVGYYSFDKDSLQNNNYQLRVLNNRVYFTGKLRTLDNNLFSVANVMVYDYNLQQGDTLKVSHAASGLNYQLKIDSIVPKTYLDNLTRDKFYFTALGDGIEHGFNEIYGIKGLGSSWGLLPFNLKNRKINRFSQSLVSVCQKEQPIYTNGSVFNAFPTDGYCSEDTFKKVLIKEHTISIARPEKGGLQIFPNPAANFINLRLLAGAQQANIKCFNAQGKLMMETAIITENSLNLDVSQWETGIYPLLIEQAGKIYWQKLVKVSL